MTDSGSANISNWCEEKQVPCFVGNPRNGKASTFFSKYPVDVLLSVNYLFIIERDLIQHPKKYAFNMHGSLLPKYRGRTPHVWAIINGETQTGVTLHVIDEGCDTGDIVIQEKVKIEHNDTGADILSKFEVLYPLIAKE